MAAVQREHIVEVEQDEEAHERTFIPIQKLEVSDESVTFPIFDS